MLYFRKGRWREASVTWDEPLFEPVRHLADGYYLDAVLAGHSHDIAVTMVEKRLYTKILGDGQPIALKAPSLGVSGQPIALKAPSLGVSGKKHDTPKNKKKYA
jgi:hypothetical protein